MSLLPAILAATLAGGLLSVCLAALVSVRLGERMNHPLLAFAAGVMLSAACLDILPEALGGFASLAPTEPPGFHARQLFVTLLAGILMFFALERLALWRHAHPGCSRGHGRQPDGRARSAAVLILIGDAFHNFVDGVLIAAAFLADPALGWATTAAIVAHELPQELGDFVILLCAGWSRRHALLANALGSLTAVVGGIVGYFFLQAGSVAVPYVLTLAAASFIYIAVADLLPILHRQLEGRFARQAAWLLAGIAIIPGIARALPPG